MAPSQRTWTDEKVDAIIGTLLRSGVILAASVVLVGGLCYLIRHGTGQANYGVFNGGNAESHSISGILKGVLTWQCRSVIQLGLLLLIATPVARVAFSVFAFAFERDWAYVVITLIVFAILLFSLLSGYGGG